MCNLTKILCRVCPENTYGFLLVRGQWILGYHANLHGAERGSRKALSLQMDMGSHLRQIRMKSNLSRMARSWLQLGCIDWDIHCDLILCDSRLCIHTGWNSVLSPTHPRETHTCVCTHTHTHSTLQFWPLSIVLSEEPTLTHNKHLLQTHIGVLLLHT